MSTPREGFTAMARCLYDRADKHSRFADELLDEALVLTVLANLPDDLVALAWFAPPMRLEV